MNKFYLPLLAFVFLLSCKSSEPNLNGTEKVKAEDFLSAFQDVKLPTLITDTSLKTISDTTVISKAVFMQFVADSALNSYPEDAVIHPAGIIHKKERDYLMATFTSNKQMQLGVFALDDKHKFLASASLLDNAKKDKYNYSLSITEEPTFIVKRDKLSADNLSMYSRNGYAYSSVTKNFNEVLHDSNEDTSRINQIINPIDTFAQANKYSGDYITDKKNFISIRDGKNDKAYFFFVHFEKSKSDCVGELKGTMTMTNDKEAVFTDNGDPCVIDFKFTSNSIKIKEQGNCGNHRGITCPFDFTFKKKVEEKKKSK